MKIILQSLLQGEGGVEETCFCWKDYYSVIIKIIMSRKTILYLIIYDLRRIATLNNA